MVCLWPYKFVRETIYSYVNLIVFHSKGLDWLYFRFVKTLHLKLAKYREYLNYITNQKFLFLIDILILVTQKIMIILQQYFKELYHFYSIVEICNMNLSTYTTKKNKSNLIFLWQYLYYEQRNCLDYGTIRIRSIIQEYSEWSHCICGQNVLWSVWIKIQDMIYVKIRISFMFGSWEWFILFPYI